MFRKGLHCQHMKISCNLCEKKYKLQVEKRQTIGTGNSQTERINTN